MVLQLGDPRPTDAMRSGREAHLYKQRVSGFPSPQLYCYPGACCTALHGPERASSQSLTFDPFGPYNPEQPRAAGDLFGPDVQL